jgi:3-hydroxyacyl-[acyl-carrier-protein] dehydratase
MNHPSHGLTHWTVPLDHPAFVGHFPGMPILPGVVLLDIALQAIADANGIALDACVISSVKFLSPASPGDALVIQHTISTKGSIHFDILAGIRKVATGNIVPRLLL